MESTRRPHTLRPARIRRRRKPPLLLAAPLLLVLAACGSSQAAGGTDPGNNGITTVEKNGVQLTISPSSGPVGTVVNVTLTGVPKNTGYGVVSFKDATGAFGEDELTSDYVVDSRTVGEGGSLHLVYKIPANVLVTASPDAQAATRKTPTTSGSGAVVFAGSNVELAAPFNVVSGPLGVGQ